MKFNKRVILSYVFMFMLYVGTTLAAQQSSSGIHGFSGTSRTVATTTGTLTSGNCVSIDANGNLVDNGAACGGGASDVTKTGTPANGNLTKWSGASTISNGDLSGDVTTSGTLAATVAKINGATLGTTTATDKNILIANGTQWVSQAMSGDVTIGNTGVTAIGNSKVTNAMLAGAIDLTAKVTGILPTANGGTANAFFTVSGPATSAKTFTFPNASSTVLTDNAAVTVAQGGTGQTSYTNGQLLIGNTTGNTLTKATLTAGTGITVTNGGGSITIAAATGSTIKTGICTDATVAATAGTALPFDDTIPQSTEGDQVMSCSYTPASSTSSVLIDWQASMSGTAVQWACALFVDSGANAVQVTAWSPGSTTIMQPARISYKYTSTDTSSHAFKVRCGQNAGSAMVVNGTSGAARKYGSAMAMTMTLTEFQ